MKNAAIRLVIVSWAMIVILSPVSVLSSDTREEKSPDSELHQLSNEVLIKQAHALLNEASDKFLAQLRSLEKSEIFLDQARQKTKALDIPKEKPTLSNKETPAKAVKIRLEHAKKRLDAFNRKIALIQTEKKFLDNYIEEIEATQAEASSFADEIERLNLFLLEISLRTNDGSLSPNMIPQFLNKTSLKFRKKELFSRREELNQKSDNSRQALEQIVLRTENTQNAAIEAKAVYALTKEKNTQELKRQTLEQEYSRVPPKRLLTQISELQEEQVWLESALNLSKRHFDKHQGNVNQIQGELESMQHPESVKFTEIRPEEAQKAGKILGKITVYYDKRIEKLKTLRTALISLKKQGESLTGDARVLNEHLFKMQVVAKVLEDFVRQGKIAEDAVPADTHLKALTSEGNKVAKINSDIRTAVKKARDDLSRTDADIENSEKSREEANSHQADLKKAYEAARQALQWEAELKDINSKELVHNFQQNRELLEKNLNALQTHRKKFEETDKSVKEVTQHFESLKDPFMRSALEESSEEKQNIIKKLYGLAGLELPDKKTGAKTLSTIVPEKKQSARCLIKRRIKLTQSRNRRKKTRPHLKRFCIRICFPNVSEFSKSGMNMALNY